jgi:hypothetical protein
MKLSVIALLLASAALPLGCGEREVSSPEKPAVRVSDIANQPEQYFNKPVSVVAEVAKVYGPNAFTLDKGGLAGSDVLVIAESPKRPATEDDDVMVTGTVRRMDAGELQRTYPWFHGEQYPPEVFAQFKDKPVIVASAVRDQEDGDVIAGVQGDRQPMPIN